MKKNHDLSQQKTWAGVVLSNNNIATFIKELVVKITSHETISYQPGCYLNLHVPPFSTNTDEWISSIPPKFLSEWKKQQMLGKEIDYKTLKKDSVLCSFSIASYPAEGNLLKFNIRIAPPPLNEGKLAKNLPWGICSSYAFSLKAGDSVHFSGPYGEALMIDDDRELIFLVGGSGASFARSHLLHLFRTRKTRRKVTLWYGARSHKDNLYEEEFSQLANDFQNFSYYLVLSEPDPEDILAGWPAYDPAKTNWLFKAFEEAQLKNIKDPNKILFYVCGPPLLNISVLQLLSNYRVNRENVVLDDFNPIGK